MRALPCLAWIVTCCASAWAQTPSGERADPAAPSREATADQPADAGDPAAVDPAAPGPGGPPGGPPRGWSFKFAPMFEATLPAAIDDGDASVGVVRAELSGDVSRPVGPVILSLGAGHEYSDYDFREARNLDPPRPPTPKDPWNQLHTTSLNLSALAFLGRSWGVRVAASLRMGYEADAELERSTSVAAFATVSYNVDRSLRLTFGVGFFTRIEDDPQVIPALGVSWRPTEWFQLEILGPTLRVTVKPDDVIDLYLAGGWANRQYRLDRRRSFYARHVVEHSQVELVVGLILRPTPWLEWNLEAGGVLYQEIELRDADGDKVYRLQPDPAPLLATGLTLRF